MPRVMCVRKTNLDKTKDLFEIHKFILPMASEPGFYRQVMSLNAFFNGRRRHNWHGLFLYTCNTWEEFEHEAARWAKFGYDQLELPIITHQNIWDFYKHEGFDYKTKKWVNNGTCNSTEPASGRPAKII
jgi:hypothetical protein